jgi:hypothetical protein
METFTQHLTAEQIGLLPTEEDVAFYEEHGWYISKKVIPDEMIEEGILGCEKFYRGRTRCGTSPQWRILQLEAGRWGRYAQ